ncbi:MAG: hypothetical protein P9M08_13230 [Candidatus Erginobacter occultus]|nr:hypothetical protein [Candidatus Erginobacter occultus]
MNPETDRPPRDEIRILLGMLRALLNDLKTIQQLGAGYYDSGSFISRYNKLLEVARDLLPDSRLIQTFSPLETSPSVDPVEKMKATQKVLIEGGQLISLIQSVLGKEDSPSRD